MLEIARTRGWLCLALALVLGCGDELHVHEKVSGAAPTGTESRGRARKDALAAMAQRGMNVVPADVVRKERPKRWAVLIGVDKYDDEVGIGSLKYCGQDMKLLYQVLTGPGGGFAPDNVLLMTADAKDRVHRPTRDNIVTMVPNWLAYAGPEDDVLIAFSGHGIEEKGKGYLLPSTTRRGNVRLTAVPLAFVMEALDACKARCKILVVDACHAGAGKGGAAAGPALVSSPEQGKGFFHLSSCGLKQMSNEDPDLVSPVGKGHGVFTYYLAEGIGGRADRDGNGRVDADEAYVYAFAKTRVWARRKGLQQDPQRSGQVTGVMTISYGFTAGLADTGHANALQSYREACRRVDWLRWALKEKRGAHRDTASVVRELKAKLDAALAARNRHALAALRDANARLARLDATRAQTAKETLPKHPRIREIDREIATAIRELSALVADVHTNGSASVTEIAPTLYPAAARRLSVSGNLGYRLAFAQDAEATSSLATKAREALRRMRGEPGPRPERPRPPGSADFEKVFWRLAEVKPDSPETLTLAKEYLEADSDGAWPLFGREQVDYSEKSRFPLGRVVHLGDGVTMRTILIPPGEFMMGSEDGESDERPVHKVRITEPFYLGIHEVTQAQWQAVMGSNPSKFKGANRPVEQVSWNDAQEFIKMLYAQEKVRLCLKKASVGTGTFGRDRLWGETPPFLAVAEDRSALLALQTEPCRLPTEAEWEYACRAGTTTRFYSGDGDSSLGRIAWYDGNSSRETHEVGQKLPNAFGLCDMSGNVWEWCQSLAMGYPYSDRGGREHLSFGGSRVSRGGSWHGHARYCRSAYRGLDGPAFRFDTIGFRVVVAACRPRE